ncbi:MAG: hypothetical protein ACI9AB_001238, partial [Urechidicola sp.]
KASIYHGKINTLNSSWSVDLEIFEDNDLEYGYPNLSFSGQTPYDEQLIISFNHSSIDSFPGVSAIYYRLNDGYSERLHLISGTSRVDVLNGSFERWGDYSGSQKKYNEPGTVWLNGFMGSRNSLARNPNQHKTFIAKLISPDSLATRLNDVALQTTSLFPNPVANQFFFEFDLKTESYLKFELFDMQGKLIDKLLEEHLKEGRYEFLFTLNPLSKGVYSLRVSNKMNELMFTQKILKE